MMISYGFDYAEQVRDVLSVGHIRQFFQMADTLSQNICFVKAKLN